MSFSSRRYEYNQSKECPDIRDKENKLLKYCKFIHISRISEHYEGLEGTTNISPYRK